MKQDSKELSPRSLDKMLLKRQVNSQNVQSTQLSKFFKFSKSSEFYKSFVWFSNMSKLVQIQVWMIWIVTIHKILKHVWTCSNMSKLVQIQYDTNCYNSYDSQTCLNMFRINNHDMNCYDYGSQTIWYQLIQLLNMSRHVNNTLRHV